MVSREDRPLCDYIPLAFGNVGLLIKGEDEGSKQRIKIGPTTVRGRIVEGESTFQGFWRSQRKSPGQSYLGSHMKEWLGEGAQSNNPIQTPVVCMWELRPLVFSPLNQGTNKTHLKALS